MLATGPPCPHDRADFLTGILGVEIVPEPTTPRYRPVPYERRIASSGTGSAIGGCLMPRKKLCREI